MKKIENFEAALKRLEKIVETLETGVDELDKIVALYEEGMELSRFCSSKLEKIENRIEILSEKMTKPEQK